MAKSDGFTDRLHGFAERVKAEPVQMPVQKVTPVQAESDSKNKDDLKQLNVWIPKDLLKRLKVKGAEANKSLKDMAIEALTQYL